MNINHKNSSTHTQKISKSAVVTHSTNESVQHTLKSQQQKNFIIQADGIFINPEHLQDSTTLLHSIDALFENNYILKKGNYQLLEQCLYFSDQIQDMSSIKIAEKFGKISEKRQEKYTKPIIFRNSEAEYVFSKIYEEYTDNTGETKEREVLLHIDEFYACMWRYGIKFGLKIEEIQKILTSEKTQKIVIAEMLNATPGKNAQLQAMRAFGRDTGPATNAYGKLDTTTYKRTLIEVTEDEPLYKKIDVIPGKTGRDIFGNSIQPQEAKDLKIEIYSGKGTYVRTIDETSYIFAQKKGYAQGVQGTYKSKGTPEESGKCITLDQSDIKQAVTVTDHAKLPEIGPETGNIYTNNQIEIDGDVCLGYKVKGDTGVVVTGNVMGAAYSNQDIHIGGSTSGSVNLQSVGKSRVETIRQGYVVSTGGDIQIDGNAGARSYIESLLGSISINRCENALIVGKNIHIENARNSTIIGENIAIQSSSNCTFIVRDTLEVESMNTKNQQENICFIIRKEGAEKALENIDIAIKNMKSTYQEQEKSIQELSQELQKISNDNRMKVLFGITQKKENATPQEQELLAKFSHWYKQKQENFKKINTQLKKIKELMQYSKKQLSELENEQNHVKQLENETTTKISCSMNTAKMPVYVHFVKNINFSELTKSDIVQFLQWKKSLGNTENPQKPVYFLPSGKSITWNFPPKNTEHN